MDIDSLIDEVIAREGGYSNHPADRGGPTRFGITQAVARAQGYAGDMRAFPRAQALAIYRKLYWTAPGLDRIAHHAPRLAAELFDTGVNMGPGIATNFLHRALNALNRGGSDYADIPAVATVTPDTEKALAAFMARRGRQGEIILLRAVEALQGERYLRLAEQRPANEAFLYGWLSGRIANTR